MVVVEAVAAWGAVDECVVPTSEPRSKADDDVMPNDISELPLDESSPLILKRGCITMGATDEGGATDGAELTADTGGSDSGVVSSSPRLSRKDRSQSEINQQLHQCYIMHEHKLLRKHTSRSPQVSKI